MDESTEWSAMWNSYVDPGFKYPSLDFEVPDESMNMSIDPSALHFDYQHDLSQQLLSVGYPFTFTPHEPSYNNDPFFGLKPRRLSITSSSSSSGASLSPVMEPSIPAGGISPSSGTGTPNTLDPAEQLAERVRQSAGVMLAVPGNVRGPQQSMPDVAGDSSPPTPRLPRAPKLPARAPRRAPKSTSSSAMSSPGPDDLTTTTIHTGAPGSSTSVIGRPKTSHTTIERRYRTNLNARIQSLRAAVPALRVLEDYKSRNGGTNAYGDVVDERGFVDGVKVARKGSKANVLGKAVEYIRVLKKREVRLKREQNGLKSLVCGLVGGPALLKEWEQEWRNKFGGEEKDEVEGEEAEPLSDGEDEEDGDEDGEGRDDDEGRARKKPRVVKARKEKERKPETVTPVLTSSLAPSAPSAVPEKRKRGRPRKVQPSACASVENSGSEASSASLASVVAPAVGQGQGRQQYLLATFALFSFFNSPLTSSHPSSSSHSHSGVVLGHTPTATPIVTNGAGWHDLVQMFHLLVSALVFLSIVFPWLPMNWKTARFLHPLSSLLSTPGDRTLTRARSGSGSAEAETLRQSMGVREGVLGLAKCVLFGAPRRSDAWMRLAELVTMDATTPLTTRMQIYWSLRTRVTPATSPCSDLATLALLVRPLSGSRATALWRSAGRKEVVVGRAFEKFVVRSLSVAEAATNLACAASGRQETLLAALATPLLRERMTKHCAVLFVRAVSGDAEGEEQESLDRELTLEAAKSLGGRMAELAEALERVSKSGCLDLDESQAEEDSEIVALLNALVLYRAMIASPSSFQQPALLRRVLGSPAFEGDVDERLEEARDQLVEMLVETERASCGRNF